MQNVFNVFRRNLALNLVPKANTSNPSYIVMKRPFKPKRRLVPVVQKIIPDTAELAMSNSVLEHVNNEINKNQGRTFAVVQLENDQFKVTEGDVITVEKPQHYTVGDKIHLRKVLLAGSNDFTIFGQPLISNEHINVTATVIEKTFSESRMNFTMIGGKNVRIMKVQRRRLSLLRINKIDLIGNLPTSTEARQVWKE